MSNRFKSLCLSLLTLAGLSAGSAHAQLLHRYDFETAGSVNDTVGAANGVLYGTAMVTNGALVTAGTIGALSGGVPQNCAGLPAAAVAGLTNAFSLEVWYAANYNGGYCTLFSFSGGNTANYVLATPARGTSPFQSDIAAVGGGGNTTEQLADQIYCDNATLHDLIISYDGTNVTYYLDGTLPTFSGLQNTFADPHLNLSSLTNIGLAGGSPWSTDNTINGKVYDFRIYGQALTLNQVAAVYSLGTNASNVAISNAVVTPVPYAQIPSTGNLVRMPFYGTFGLHDPGTMRKDGNSYFIFGDGTGIPGITSTDLRNWSSTTAVFPGGPPAWTTNAVPGGTPNYFWAPDTAYFNGLWHMYYAYSQWATINSVIGVATSPSLTSPVWTDHGKVVQSNYPSTNNTDTTAYNCIDPSIYVAANGTVWMSYGSYSSGILVTQIDPTTGLRLNTGSVGTQVANNAPGGGWGSSEEGSCIYQHGGYWYLFVNWGGCCDLTYSTYNIRVGRATTPTGPYYDKNGVDLDHSGGTMFLESTARYIGPGHAAIMQDVNGTNWFTYHFYDGLANGNATVAMDQLYWSADGWPVLTNDWSVLYPLSADANESGGNYNGTLQNSAGFTNDPVRGNSLYLDGVTKYVSLPLSVGNASTFATWVYWRGGAAWQRIFDFGNDTTNYFFLTPSASTGAMRFAINVGGAGEQQINAPSALPANSWHHVAVTLDGKVGILYLDGAPVATNTSLTYRPWQTTPHNNNLGKSQFATDPYFAGELGSFRIFGRALSAAEIGDIFKANAVLAHRYSFNTNTPAGWDSIGMAHGTLIGGATVTNNALKLTGVSGTYANLPGGLVSGSSAVTLECWATLGVNGNWARIFDTGNINGANGGQYFFYSPHNGTSGQRTQLSTSTTTTLDTSGTLDNRTVHVTCICDPANSYLAVYTNGVLEAQQTSALSPLTSVGSAWSFIGRSLWSSDAYLNGTIDELRLYDGRLTPQQIVADDVAGPNLIGLFDVWGGAGTNQNWSTSGNWLASKTPNSAGDLVFFAGNTGLAPNLDVNVSVAGLTFATNAGSFTLITTNASTLTLTGDLVNNSFSAQTLNVPAALNATQTINTAPGNLTLAGTISGTGNLTKLGPGKLTLSGADLFNGNTILSAGTLELAQNASALATNSTVSITSGAVLQLDNGAVTNFVASLRTNGLAAGNGLYGSANSSGFITGAGYLQVGPPPIGPTGPGFLTNSLSGATLSLAWPPGLGWRLQSQTNSLSAGLGTNWIYVTDGTVSSTNIIVDPTGPTIFYRLKYP